MFYRLLAMYASDNSHYSKPILLFRQSFSVSTDRWQTTDILATSNSSSQSVNQSNQSSTSDPLDCKSPRQTEPDLLYLSILNEAVKETTESSRHYTTSHTPFRSRPEDSIAPRNCLWTKLPHLDDIDNEYLVKKGVFDLPPPQHL